MPPRRHALAISRDPWERLIASVAFEAIWERALESDEMSWSLGVESIFGYPDSEVVGHVSWWEERVHPDDLERVVQTAEQAIRSGASRWANEYRFRRKDGTWAWVASHCATERDGKGRALRAIGAMIDITERASAEKALRETQRILLEAQRIGQARAWEEDLRTGMVKMDLATLLGSGEAQEPRPRDEAWKLIHPDDFSRLVELRRRTIETGGPFETEYRSLLPDGSERVLFVRGELVRDAAGKPERILGTALDITDRVRGEEAARASQRLLRLVLETLPVGVAFLDQAGNIQLSNPALKRIWGREIAAGDERYAKSKGAWHDSGKKIGSEEWASVRALRAGQTSLNELIDIEAFDGQRKTMRNSTVPIRDEHQAIIGAVVVNEDVTQQVRAEEELREKREQLQALSRRLIEAQEAERRAVARELHDDFGQVLTALKLNLMRRERDEAESIALVDGAIARMRDLAHDLRPPMLDELGLDASLRWYVEREARRAGLEFNLALSPPETRPTPAVEATCFRVAQEALTNVIRHAHARRVDVELGVAGGALQLLVRDDGRGFDVGDARKRATRGESQGLLSMQERVALAGGELEIDSTPGRGTAVRARFPILPGGVR
jgi:PAS domain S-box-containing protein